MKVDRVIFGLDSNPLYDEFWNLYSPVWKNRFNITPTLFFNGTKEELKSCNLSSEHGDVFLIPKAPEVVVNPSLDWSVTWSLFWGASQFPSEVCMTCGIDQLMLSDFMLKELEKVDDDKFAIGLSDAYKNYDMNRFLGSIPKIDRYFPSAYVTALGSNFKKYLDIEDEWEAEVKKVFNFSKDRYPILKPQIMWGADEVYFSEILLTNYPEKVVELRFFDKFHARRIDRVRDSNYDRDKLRSGGYTEYHSHRPYSKYKDFIDQLIRDFI